MSKIGKAEKTFIMAITGGIAPFLALRLALDNLQTENEVITFILQNKWIVGLVFGGGSYALYKSGNLRKYNNLLLGIAVASGMQMFDEALVKFMDKDFI